MDVKIETLNEIKERVLNGELLGEKEALDLLHISDKEALYKAADEIREKFVGRKFDMCSIANAKSGKCEEDCKWCSQSRHYQTTVEEYDMIKKDLAVDMARMNREQGVDRYSLVTSGRVVSDEELEQLAEIYEEIKHQSDIHLCASMGLMTKEQLQRLKNCGVEHYHCNLETAPSYFEELCSTHTIEEKIETIKWAKEIGLGICSGGIIGMGETMEQRVEFALTLQKLDVQSIPLNILHAIDGTPLAGTKVLEEEEILTTIALFRFINPKAHIRFAGGRDQLSREAQRKALHAGVSAALVGDYLTTLGTKVKDDKIMFTGEGFELDN